MRSRDFIFLRLAAFVLVALAASQLLVLSVIGSSEPDRFFEEDGILEWIQFCLVVSAGALLLAKARVSVRYDLMYQVGGLLALFAGVRELDRFFDHNVFDGAYKLIAGWIPLLCGYIVWTQRRRVVAQFRDFSTTGPFFFVLAGAVLVLVFAQLIGQHQFWQAILGDSYARIAKRAVEEMLETFGYGFIFFGAVETLFLEPAGTGIRLRGAWRVRESSEPAAPAMSGIAYREGGPAPAKPQ